MGRRMAALFERVEADMLIPLPLHRGSRRAYNQTELLARGVGESWAIPVEAEALKWKAERKPQTSKKAFERKSLSFDSFEASRIVSGRRVILVDDVYTTGGTVRAAKFALQRAGAEVAAVLVWTRRIRGAEHPAGWPDEALIEP